MRTVFLRDSKTGKFVQHKIIRGKTIDVNEDELTFHVARQKGFKILDVVELPDLTEVTEIIPVVEEEQPRKRTRSRRRKAVEETDES